MLMLCYGNRAACDKYCIQNQFKVGFSMDDTTCQVSKVVISTERRSIFKEQSTHEQCQGFLIYYICER